MKKNSTLNKVTKQKTKKHKKQQQKKQKQKKVMLHWIDSPPKHSSSNYAWPWDFHISNQMFFTDFHCLQYLCLATAAADLFGRNFSVLTFNVFSSWVLLVVVFALQCNQGSSHWGGQEGHGPPTCISKPNKISNSFSFKHQGYCFLRVFRNNTMDRNFTVFIVYATISGQFTATFHFF